MSIALSLGNNLTTGGIFKPTAVNNTSVNNVTDFASIAGGSTLVLLSTQTASASASISFTTGIDNTYDEYIFKWINCHPASNDSFQFNCSTDGGSNYNVTKTTTFFAAYHYENDSSTFLGYNINADKDLLNDYQTINSGVGGDDADNSCVGYLHLFAPSSTTYVKHFIARGQHISQTPYTYENYVAGYFDTTSAINAIDFKFATSNIDDGIIKMYGVVKS